jgi:topoisomerase-4 subunit B
MKNEKQQLKTETKTRNHRFKGLGDFPDEFKKFIGETIRLDPVMMDKTHRLNNCLSTWGKNTPDRQEFIIKNLKVELDVIDAV